MSTFTEHLTLGERLARARDHADLTQTQLADELGITRRSVFNYEGDARQPSFELVCAWAVATDVPLRYFADATLDGEAQTSSWYTTDTGLVDATYLTPAADVIDLTLPFPHHQPEDREDEIRLPLPDSCAVVCNPEHHGLTPAA